MTIESELARIADLLQKLVDAESSKSASTTTPKRTRVATAPATKAASASTEEAPATTSSTSVAPTSEAPPPAAEPAEPAVKSSPETGTSPASKEPTSPPPTLDQVRYALTQCQARSGGAIEKPRSILQKYAKTGTLGSLAEADRAKVIAECEAS